VPRPNGFEVVACYAAIGGWAWRRHPMGRRLLAGALCVLLLDAGWWLWERLAPGRVRAAFLDVGQGDAAVIELPDGRVIVVDAGGFPGTTFDTGRAVVEPYLRSRKIGRIDVLVMSHAHPDHAAGLPRLIERFRPREFWRAEHGDAGGAWPAVAAALARHGVPVRSLDAGAEADGLAVLHPPGQWPAASMNDGSLVVAVRAAGLRLLFTGDVERWGEDVLVRAAPPALLAADVLKVPHHGSRTSSTPAWVAAVAPRVAVVSVGADNRYGLPAAAVMARYVERGVCVLRTDRCGTVVVEGRAGRLDVEAVAAGPACRCPDQVVAPSPLRSANITRPTRSRTPSFWKMFVRWVFTVRSLMRSVSLTSLFL
jgi:competence protein ComEC